MVFMRVLLLWSFFCSRLRLSLHTTPTVPVPPVPPVPVIPLMADKRIKIMCEWSIWWYKQSNKGVRTKLGREEYKNSFIWPSSTTHVFLKSPAKWRYFGPKGTKKITGQMAARHSSTECLYLLVFLATIWTVSMSVAQTVRPSNRGFRWVQLIVISMVILTCCGVRMGCQVDDLDFCPDILRYPAV